MHSLQPDLLTAFGMTALAAFTVSWVMWMLGRQHWQQGMSQAVLSTSLFGLAYVFFALQSKLGVVELQATSKTLISAAMAAFTIALQRFRQSTDISRDSATVGDESLAPPGRGALGRPAGPFGTPHRPRPGSRRRRPARHRRRSTF